MILGPEDPEEIRHGRWDLVPDLGCEFNNWGYDVCSHLLSTWDYCEDAGFGAGSRAALSDFRRALEEAV